MPKGLRGFKGLLCGLLLAGAGGAYAGDTPTDPCAGTTSWRAALCDFAKMKLVHNAWGYEHSLRDYTLAKALATNESVAIDDDVLFAAAMLHDMGGFAPYAQTGVDHAVRSTQVCDPVLTGAGFPMAKAAAVKAAILNHSYYDPTRPATPEGIVLHDADGLDFLGAVSVLRILGIVGKDPAAPDPASAINLLQSLQLRVPKTIYGGAYTHALLGDRANELGAFLQGVAREAYGFGVPGAAPAAARAGGAAR